MTAPGIKIAKNQASEFCTIIHSSSFSSIPLPFLSSLLFRPRCSLGPLNLNTAAFPQNTAEQAGSDNRIYKHSHKKQKLQRKQEGREQGEAAHPPQLHP